MERLLSVASPLGLYAEEFDTEHRPPPRQLPPGLLPPRAHRGGRTDHPRRAACRNTRRRLGLAVVPARLRLHGAGSSHRGDARRTGRGHHWGSRSIRVPTADEEHEMCRWMAWFGQPVLIDEVRLQDEARDRGPEPSRPHGRRADQRRRLRLRLVWLGRRPCRLSQRRAGVGRREPARAGGAHRVAAVPRPRAGGDRLAGAADQLPSLPPRAMAVRPQRLHRRLPCAQARTDARDRPRALRARSTARRIPRSSSTSRSRSGSRRTRSRHSSGPSA